MMSIEEARYRALAAAGAALVFFLGIVHEMVGPLIFPWAPAAFGAVLWHGIGIFAIALGLLMLAGSVDLIAFPVIPSALFASIGGVVAFAFMAWYRGDFHFFALCLAFIGIGIAFCYRKALRLRRD